MPGCSCSNSCSGMSCCASVLLLEEGFSDGGGLVRLAAIKSSRHPESKATWLRSSPSMNRFIRLPSQSRCSNLSHEGVFTQPRPAVGIGERRVRRSAVQSGRQTHCDCADAGISVGIETTLPARRDATGAPMVSDKNASAGFQPDWISTAALFGRSPLSGATYREGPLASSLVRTDADAEQLSQELQDPRG